MCCLCSPAKNRKNNQWEHANFRSTQTWESRIAQLVHFYRSFAFPLNILANENGNLRFPPPDSLSLCVDLLISSTLITNRLTNREEIFCWRDDEFGRGCESIMKHFAINLKYYDIMSRIFSRCQIIRHQIYVDSQHSSVYESRAVHVPWKIDNLSSTMY